MEAFLDIAFMSKSKSSIKHIVENLTIKPDKSWEPESDSPLGHQHGRFFYKIGLEDSNFSIISKEVDQLLERVALIKNEIKIDDFYIQLSISIELEEDEEISPNVFLTNKAIKILAELNSTANIEFCRV